jgi:hypothetical protein
LRVSKTCDFLSYIFFDLSLAYVFFPFLFIHCLKLMLLMPILFHIDIVIAITIQKNIYIQKNEDSTHKDRWIWRRLNGDGGNRIEWKKKRNLLPEERRRRLTSGVDLTVWMWMREKYIYIFYPLFLELKRDIIWDESVFWDKTEKLSFFSSHFSYVISFY